MFGYVKPLKPEMKMIEFDTYKAIYCGLCKQLGKVYGPFARLTLSYDFTFLAVVSLGFSEQCAGFKKQICVVNPLKKKPCMCPCDDLTFAASVAMLMLYYKVLDNYRDSGFWGKLGSLCIRPFFAHARKKAMKRYPEIDRIIGSAMAEQAVVEQKNLSSIDAAAEPTARAMAEIAKQMTGDENQKRVLDRFGYLLGKWVYLMDAYDDLEDDLQTGNFNPIRNRLEITAWNEETRQQSDEFMTGLLNLTVTELAKAYELLELKRYKSILDNIIYLGLKDVPKQIAQKKETKKHE